MSQPPYGYPSPYPGAPFGGMQPVQHPGATTSMVLGIVSIVAAVGGFCLCGFLGVAGALIGPFGIWQALRATSEIDAAPGRYNNRGNAAAGLVCSIAGTALGLLVLIVTTVLIVIYGVALTQMDYS